MRPLAVIPLTFLASAAALGQGVSDAGPPPDELHEAPQPHTENAPPEAQLSPPPDAEKLAPELGFIQIDNPAFPPERGPAPVPEPAPGPPAGRRYTAADIEPYFRDGPAAQAKAEFDRGNFTRARTLLERAGDANPVRYLRALCAFRALSYGQALEEFAALALAYPAMRDHCLTHAGIAAEELQRWAAAVDVYGKVQKDSRMYPDARLGLYRAARHLGDLEGARAAIAPLAEWPAPGWGRDVGAEGLIGLADLAHAQKDGEGERRALLRLWSTHPLSPLAKQAERRLGGKLPLEAQVTRAEALVENNRNALGIAAVQPLLAQVKLPDPLACRASFVYGKALRKERQHGRAIAALQPVVDQCDDPDLRPRALYVLGSSRSIVDPAHGPKTYELLAHDYPGHVFADDALFYAADLYLHGGDPDSALARLKELADKYPGSDFAGEALFRTFWIRRARGETQLALAALDTAEAIYKDAADPYELERARYWRARQVAATDAAKGLDGYEALATEHPTTYYGYLAVRRIEELDAARAHRVESALAAPAEVEDIWPVNAGPLSDDPHLLTAVELLRLGFKDAAPTELLAISRPNQPAESIRLIVYLLAAAGDPQQAHGVARVSLRRDLSGRIDRGNRRLWELAYPHAYREMVERHCKAAKVDPDLLQALMREESALDPRALSWAGALGLTQLMLPTARSVARTLKIPNVNQALLLQPDLNIQIGSWYLGELVRQFKGQKEFALAGYNAGGHNVSKWRAAQPAQPIDEWVEEIPFSETRGYVKRVLRSYFTYHLLYPARDAGPQARASAEH